MANSQPVSEADTRTPSLPVPPPNPLKNPAYPQRTHLHERAHWEGILVTCEKRIALAVQKLNALGNAPERAAYDRLHAQMLGARDQVADAARRLPGETGDLYQEDRHRLDQAVAALDRIFLLWDVEKS